MLPKGHETIAPLDPLAERLRRAGLKLTPQRLAIFRALRASRSHPTAEEVYREVRVRVPMISRNTIYQTLEALKRVGEISEVGIGDVAARYEPNQERHDHAVCLGCRTIIDIPDESTRRPRTPRRLGRRFKVLGHRIEFLGYCADCLGRGARPRTARPRGPARGASRG